MASTCAICLSPFRKDQTFVIAGTEVVHPDCLKARGTGGTLGSRRKVEIAELEARSARLVADLELSQARLRARDLLEQDLERVRGQLHEHTRMVDDYRGQRDRFRRERDEAIAARNDAIAARDAKARELALVQQLGHQAPQEVDPPKQEEDLDDAKKRFSLLELD